MDREPRKDGLPLDGDDLFPRMEDIEPSAHYERVAARDRAATGQPGPLEQAEKLWGNVEAGIGRLAAGVEKKIDDMPPPMLNPHFQPNPDVIDGDTKKPYEPKYKTKEAPLVQKRPDGQPNYDPSVVAQGYLGDCWFIAGLAAEAHNQPKVLMEDIKDNGDGTFVVTLYLRGKDGARHATPIAVDSSLPMDNGTLARVRGCGARQRQARAVALTVRKSIRQSRGRLRKN